MAYPRRLLTDNEEVVSEFHPHWRVLLVAMLWLLLGVAAVIVGFWQLEPPWRWVLMGIAVPVSLGFAIPPIVRWRFTFYVLTTERIIRREGLVSRASTEIPLENINNVLFTQSVMERLLGFGDVLIESAGSQGQTHLHDIPDPEGFQSQVYRIREARSMHLKGSGNRGGDGGNGGGGMQANDPVARLQALADLHERGALNDAEFEESKAKLLGEL
jgi:membrane protein YdbS with pleckstrin-like domain